MIFERNLEWLYGKIQIWVVVLLVSTYLIFMLRVHGVDMPIYRHAYYYDYQKIPDLGFQLLMRLFNFLKMPHKIFMVTMGIVNIVSLKRIASYFRINFALLLVVWFLHIAVIRDFAQLRIGFAVSLFFLGITSKSSWKKITFYILSVSIHYSVIILVIAYEFCDSIAKIKKSCYRLILFLTLSGGVLLCSLFITKFSFLFERIAIYASWDKSGYGNPVENYTSLYLNFFILFVSLITYRNWKYDTKIRTIFYLQFFGIISFVALSDIAIFAYRLSNILISFYPVLFLISISVLRVRVAQRSISNLISMSLFLLLCFALLLRPNSYSIIKEIGF